MHKLLKQKCGIKAADKVRLAHHVYGWLVGAILVGVLATSATLLSSGSAHAACANTPDPAQGTDTQSINVATAGTYTVWSRLLAPDTTNNSYYLQIDGGCAINVGDSSTIPASTWTWVNYQDGNTGSVTSVNLTAGAHQIVLNGRDPGVEVDRVLFLSDKSCTPSGTGENCSQTKDTSPPVVNLTAPVNATTVSGTTTISADASDNVGVSSVQFKLDGANLGTPDTTAPYSVTWDTTKASTGSHTLTAVATDAANNTASSSVTVTVNNTGVFTCSGSLALICQDFSSPAANFITIGGTWNTSGGQYVLTNPTQGSDTTKYLYNKALYNLPLTGDFTMTFDGTAATSSGSFADFGTVFDYKDENNYYYADFNTNSDFNGSGLFKVVDGIHTQLASISGPITPNTIYHIKIVRSGSNIAVFRNGTQVATSNESTFTGGTVGLGSRVNPASFDNLVVTGSGTSGGGDTTPPTAPTNLVATVVSSSQINLTWSPSTDNVGVIGYRIYRNGGTSPIATVTTTSYGDSGLSAGTKYTYTVVAIDAANNSSTAATATATTTATAPTNVTVQGTVTNKTTGLPINAAYVHTGAHATKSGAASAYTNSSGQYVLTNIIAKVAHSYTYTANGYKSKGMELKFPIGINIENVNLTPKK